MTQKSAIVWFRQDLRLSDNPALHEALNDGYAIIPLYLLDDDNAAKWKLGGAARLIIEFPCPNQPHQEPPVAFQVPLAANACPNVSSWEAEIKLR